MFLVKFGSETIFLENVADFATLADIVRGSEEIKREIQENKKTNVRWTEVVIGKKGEERVTKLGEHQVNIPYRCDTKFGAIRWKHLIEEVNETNIGREIRRKEEEGWEFVTVYRSINTQHTVTLIFKMLESTTTYNVLQNA